MKEWESISRRLNIWFICATFFALVAFLQIGCTRSEIPEVVNDIPLNAVPSPTATTQPTPPQDWNDGYNFVNGIRIGSSYAELKQIFGKPVTEKRGGENACGSIKTVAAYKGISFTLDDDNENNIVVLIEIVSPEWELTPGVSVGMNIEQIRTKMGRDGWHRKDEVETLGYGDGDGNLTFQFAGGKVAKITRDLNLC